MSGGAAAGAGVAAAGLDQAPAPRHHPGRAHPRHRERSPMAQAGGQAGALTGTSTEHGLLLRYVESFFQGTCKCEKNTPIFTPCF